MSHSLQNTLFTIFIITLLNTIVSLNVAAQTIHEKKDSLRTYSLQEIEIARQQHTSMLSGFKEGKIVWNMSSLNNLPQLLGSADPMRYLQLLPGVQTNTELTSGIFIQGCDNAHNQIEINSAPVYNAMHLLGIFSIFNNNHFSNLSLQKSALPASAANRIGGHLSMQTKDSIAKNIILEGSVGIVASQGTLTIPTGKQGTLYLSGRATYLNLLYGSLMKFDRTKMEYGFHDINATHIWQPSGKHKIISNFYYGGDNLGMFENNYQADGRLRWNNIVASIVWDNRLNNKQRLNQTAYVSRYRNRLHMNQSGMDFTLPSGILDYGYKGKMTQVIGMCLLTGGIDYAHHHINPQNPKVTGSFNNTYTPVPQQNADEVSIYTSLKWLPIEQPWSFETGLRGTFFTTQDHHSYASIDPRFTLSYETRWGDRITAHYGVYHQYLHQTGFSGMGLPTDFWMAAGSFGTKPQYAHSFSIGYYGSFSQGKYDFSVEAYYKLLSHQTEYNGSVFDLINTSYTLSEHLLNGKGRNYGIDFIVKKNTGHLTGWLSYSFGRARRKYPILQNGFNYPSSHERQHDLTAVATYALSRRLTLGAVFVYASGTPYTAPLYGYILGQNIILQYSELNSARMPAYHRLDLSVNYWFKKEKKHESGINFSIYNAYAHKNPLYMHLKFDPNHFEIYPVHLLRTLPSISYFFKF